MAKLPLARSSFVLNGLLNLARFALVSALLLGLSYLLGHQLLSGALPGNDSALHLGYVVWLDRYFPEVPDWFPLQGGGVSLLHGYPLLPHLTVVVLSRASGLTLHQAYRLVGFLSLPLSAIGIYLLGWSMLRRRSLGFIAAVLYLLAPVSWTWLHDWGFFAQQVAFIALPLALLTFERALSHTLAPQPNGKRRLWLVATGILFLLGGLSHMMIGTAAALGSALYTLFLSLSRPRRTRGVVIVRGLRVLLLLAVLGTLISAAYWIPFLRYGQQANQSASNVPETKDLHDLPIAEFFGLRPIDDREILTRMQFPVVESLLALLGLAFAVGRVRRDPPGTRQAFAISLSLVAALVYALSPGLVALTLKLSSLLVMFVNFRSLLLLAMVLLPLVAAYGAVEAAAALARPATTPLRLLRSCQRGNWMARAQARLVPLLSVGLAAIALLPGESALTSTDWSYAYGPLPKGLDLRDLWGQKADDPCGGIDPGPALCSLAEARARLNISDFYQGCALGQAAGAASLELCTSPQPDMQMVTSFIKQCEVAAHPACAAVVRPAIQQLTRLEEWPPLMIRDSDPLIAQTQRLAELIPNSPGVRLDVSPYQGRLAQDLTAYSGASQLNSYTYQINLIHEMWGYQQNVFYGRDEGVAEYGSPVTLNSMARWFGTEYVFLEPSLDSVETYLAAGWQQVLSEETTQIWSDDLGSAYLFIEQDEPRQAGSIPKGWQHTETVRAIELWRFPTPEGLVTAGTKPAVLIIGQPENDAYMTLFRLANDGVIPYEEAWLVDGGASLDDYDLDLLRPFAAVVLYGHDYSDSEVTWALLENYVNEGGSLFVDTGWEYRIPEWTFETAPRVLPMERLVWTDYGSATEYQLGFERASGSVDVSQFKPLTWEGRPWTLSGGEMQDVREWGQVVLAAGGGPLVVAGEFGSGRVVWSGMNLIGHSLYLGKNAEELKLVQNLLAWLVSSDPPAPVESYPALLTRDHPDRVELSFPVVTSAPMWVYWREAFYPNWRAYLNDGLEARELPIYRGGPGFMMIPIPVAGSGLTLSLRWEPNLAERIGTVLSLAGIGLLLALSADGLALQGMGFSWLRIGFLTRLPTPFLGEGSNREWAERKRAELQSADDYKLKTYQPAEAIPWMRPEAEASADPGQSEPSNGRDPEEPLSIEEHERLLASWLDETGHTDDGWAERLLGKKQSNKES